MRRVQTRDSSNIRSVGFAPARPEQQLPNTAASLPVTAQFDVHRKLRRVPAAKRVESVEAVRLLDRPSRRFLQLALATDVLPTGDIVPTGVQVNSADQFATASAVVRWTKAMPVSSVPIAQPPDDPRWRWGMLSVAHLFAATIDGHAVTAQIERGLTCGQGPQAVSGRVIVRGRVPGGPDLCLIETGLDRLWLSGLLSRPDAPVILPADEPQLLRWISRGTSAVFLGDGVQHACSWQSYYPELTIENLGELPHIVRYEATDAVLYSAPFGPGSSGGVLLAGGIPIGVQVAAMVPIIELVLHNPSTIRWHGYKNNYAHRVADRSPSS